MATITNTYWLLPGLSGKKQSGVVTQEESVIITFDSVIDNVDDAIRESGLKPGSFHRNINTLILQDGISAEPVSNGSEWRFDLSYSTRSFGSNEAAEDDEFYVPKVSFGKWTYTRVVDKDKVSGDAIVNTAGDPYDPLPIETISSPTISVTVKENSPNLNRIFDIGAINSQQFRLCGLTIPKYCAMLDDFQPEPYQEGEDVLSFLNTYTFKLKFFKNTSGSQIGFKLETLSAGYNQIVSTKKVEIRVKDPDSPDDSTKDQPIATPQMLDVDGAVTTTPYYQEWVVHDVVNFSVFGLPTNYPVA